MAYSHHFIKKVLKLKSEGMSFSQLTNKFNISVRSIQEWRKGNLPKGARNKPNTKLDLERLKKRYRTLSRCIALSKSGKTRSKKILY